MAAVENDDLIAWYENETIHRSAAFPAETLISPYIGSVRGLVAGDIDGDGDLDVVTAGTKVAWFANSDGAAVFDSSYGGQNIISNAINAGWDVDVGDIDGDGDLDVVSASRAAGPRVAWYENTGGGGFGPQQILSTDAGGFNSIWAVDVDVDGDLDVVYGTSGSAIDAGWQENLNGAGSFGAPQSINSSSAVVSVFPADLDGDGDYDLLVADAGGNEVVWNENTDGDGGFGPDQQVLGTDFLVPYFVYAADIDGDGDLDALAASRDSDKISWVPNTDGAGGFGAEQVLTTEADNARSVFAADLDADGDVDVLAASENDDTVSWFENTDGSGGFGPEQFVSTDAAGAYRAIAADLDGDGDLDVIAAAEYDNDTLWFENQGGQFSLMTRNVAQGVIADGELHDLLKIVLTHEGLAGDSDVELASLELLFRGVGSTPLTEAELGTLVSELRLYLDDGASSGVLDSSDTMVASTTDFSSITTNGGGVLTWTLSDGDSNLQVAQGSPKTYFLAAQLSGTTGPLDVEHLTESSSTGEDAPNDIPLILEFAADVRSGIFSTTLDSTTCMAPLDLQLTDRTVSATVTCNAGTVLTTETNVVVTGTGDLTLRAGQAVEMEDGLEVESGGDFTVEIDEILEP